MDFTNAQTVALWGFLVALVYGVIASKTEFCTRTAIRDWIYMDDKNMLRSWMLAIGIAIIGTQLLAAQASIDLKQSIYLTANFGWLGHLVGGLLFGVGMMLAGGCGQRVLVRFGNGNLRSLIVIVVFGLTAYMTLNGISALLRINAVEVTNVNLSAHGVSNQSIVAILMAVTGLENESLLRGIVAAAIGIGLVAYAFIDRRFRRSADNVLSGVSVGLLVVAAWYITGVVGRDEFEPVRVESFTFVAPMAANLQYMMTWTESSINFGIAVVFGVIAGSLLHAVVSGKFAIEAFESKNDMLEHIVGAVLTGFGGVLALGCTIGQGITGVSTLALGSFITLGAVIFGSVMTVKIKLYMQEKQRFLTALRSSLSDMKLWPPADDAA